MNFKKSLGMLFHQIFDKRTGINPITTKYYPEIYLKNKIDWDNDSDIYGVSITESKTEWY